MLCHIRLRGVLSDAQHVILMVGAQPSCALTAYVRCVMLSKAKHPLPSENHASLRVLQLFAALRVTRFGFQYLFIIDHAPTGVFTGIIWRVIKNNDDVGIVIASNGTVTHQQYRGHRQWVGLRPFGCRYHQQWTQRAGAEQRSQRQRETRYLCECRCRSDIDGQKDILHGQQSNPTNRF